MEGKVLETIRNYNLIDEGDQVVIGVSGGPDSMALLYILLDIKKVIPFNIYVAHVNHGVRGEAANKDEEFVRNICKDLNFPFYSIKVNMYEYAKDHNMTGEEAGRKLRYDFFKKVLKKHGRGKIAVAHNKNDQAETLIMRFMRGTGIDGLKGIPYKRGNIIRPLLEINRDEIEAYIGENKIDTRLDKTNLEPIYNRNKIRLELMPYIEENFNP
ncbi:MAG TPA: tRNA lysidine(34) synthetase TilS, partial [Tissierellales bacterium]|nr:tRNA lysidine(34) synthetase TilS [Tissierellales bacterium]